jgi:hypothetical protein
MVRGGVHVYFLPFAGIAIAMSGIDRETDDRV